MNISFFFQNLTEKMADRKIRHVEDVFKQKNHENGNNSDTDYSFNFNFKAFKNKQAPLPPGGPVPLPKIGNYQPKILLDPGQGSGNPVRPHEINSHNVARHNDDTGRHNVRRQSGDKQNAPTSPVKKEQFIIGDKNVPITIESTEPLSDNEWPIPAPRRKRPAPNVPEDNTDVIPRTNKQTTNNPLFGRSMSVRSDEETFEIDAEIQGGDIDFGPGIDNPAFNNVHLSSQRSSASEHNMNSIEHNSSERRNAPEVNVNGNIGQYPYIPPPDYDDEEITMTFGDEEGQYDYGYQQSKVYKEFEGEDFAKYLRDEEDYEFDSRPPPLRNFKGKPAPGAPKYDNRFNKKGDKPKKKSKRKEPDMKRNTIRDFAFSDSKIGWGDRTVKSTSAKGRYIKREKDRKRIETNPQQTDPGSYEEFLRIRNGLAPQESPNSSDSGVEVEMKNHENLYYHSQPKQMKNGKYDKKPSVWQKLTWRFRKSLDISRMDKT